MSFLKNPSAELKKVTWPNLEKLLRLTSLIILTIILLAVYVSSVDVLSTKIFYFLKYRI